MFFSDLSAVCALLRSLESMQVDLNLRLFCHTRMSNIETVTLNAFSMGNTTVQLQGCAALLAFLRFSKHLSHVPACV